VVAGEHPDGLKTEELAAVIQEIRERVRARNPSVAPGGMPLPDLMPIVHARDAAGAKVAAIGTVNPRPPGALNNFIQSVKKLAARLLDWHVREQVEFNRAVMAAVESILEALNENNRTLAKFAELKQEAEELKDIRSHWSQWRQEWERKLTATEVQFLRSVAELQGAFQHRVSLIESNLRELIKSQLSSQRLDFDATLERSSLEIQQRLWADLERVRAELDNVLQKTHEDFERLIHTELRLIRQRAALPRTETVAASVPGPAAAGSSAQFDYVRFAQRFRGSEEYIREKQKFYLPFFQGRSAVLDLGCGRGEFLEVMRDAGIEARGVDLDGESVAMCRSKGLVVDMADLFVSLRELPDCTLEGIFCAQVVEHLPPLRIPELIQLAAAKLVRGAPLVIETPNPECLAIFATHFYLDPTHERPVPPALLSFYMEEFGLGRMEVHQLFSAAESMPSIAALPEDFREIFFGGLDYAIVGRKL
jgi:2-polyprenyl-3-methyl-5-hydroxy-6-metoxy-1,4-benzoquinol methylase